MVQIKQVFPYLRLRRAAEAIDFYTRAFGAKELNRMTDPMGRIGHAEIQIGDTVLMLADEYPEHGIQGPESRGGTSIAIHLHVDAVDELMKQAVDAGGTIVRSLEDHFYGERSGSLRDPFGHEWLLGQEIEKVSPEEMQRRFNETFAKP